MKRRSAVNLTKKMVDALQYGVEITTSAKGRRVEPRCVLWDADVKGLGIRVYPSGKKVWVFAYKADGRKRLMQLGEYPTLTLDKARDAARGQGGRIATARALGSEVPDPLEERLERKRGTTVSHLIEAFLVQHAEAKRKPRTAAEYRRQLETHVKPRWGSRHAKTIKRADVAALHSELGQRAAVQANRVVAAVSKMFSFGKVKGFLPDDFTNPAHGVERFEERKRDRWVRPGELPRLIEEINREPNLYARAALWLYLLTGARRTELLKAKWEHVDEERCELRLPDENTKAGRTHYIPLSEAALAILAGIPREEGNPYILAGAPRRRAKKDGDEQSDAQRPGHLVNIDKPWRRICEKATVQVWRQDPRVAAVIDSLVQERKKSVRKHGKRKRELPSLAEIRAAVDGELPTAFTDVRIHDLRRTVGSWLATHGESLPLIGKVLNHTDVKTTAVYARLAEDPARRAMEEHGKRIMESAGKVRVIK